MAENSYLKALSDKYLREMRQSRPSANASGGSAVTNPLARIQGLSVPTTGSPIKGQADDQSALGKIIDVLSRPGYAIGNVMKETVDLGVDVAQGKRESNFSKGIDRGDNPINTFFNTFAGSQLSGLAGRSKVLPSDALLDRYDPQGRADAIGKFGVGLAADIFLDPLTYVPGAAIASVAKKIPGVTKATEGLRAAGSLAKKPQALPAVVAEDVPNNWPANWPGYDEMGDLASEGSGRLPSTKTTQELFREQLENLKSIPNESIRAAANTPRAADGKRVYDFKKLPALYSASKPVAAAAKKNVTTANFSDWVKQHAAAPITRSDSGDLLFSTADDVDAATLGQVVGAAVKNQGTPTATADLRLVERLFERSRSVAETGTPKSTPDPVDLATQAARLAQAGSRTGRITGAKRAKNLAYLKNKLDPEDYAYLVNSRSDATYKARRAEILSRVHSPVEASSIIESPSESLLKQVLGETVTPENIPPRTPLNPTTPAVVTAVDTAVSKQLEAAARGYKYRSKVRDVARTNVKIGKGTGIADRGFNKYAQYNMFASLVK